MLSSITVTVLIMVAVQFIDRQQLIGEDENLRRFGLFIIITPIITAWLVTMTQPELEEAWADIIYHGFLRDGMTPFGYWLTFSIAFDALAFIFLGWWKSAWFVLLSIPFKRRVRRNKAQIIPKAAVAATEMEKKNRITGADIQYHKDKHVNFAKAQVSLVSKAFNVNFDAHLISKDGSVMRFRVYRPTNIIDATLRRMQDAVISGLDIDDARFEIQPNKNLHLIVPIKTYKTRNFRQCMSTVPDGPSPVTIFLGERDNGDQLWFDFIENDSHMLVAGTSGSGKTTLMQVILASVFHRQPTTDELHVLICDTKMTGFKRFERLPHAPVPIARNWDSAVDVMRYAYDEMNKRYQYMSQQDISNFRLGMGFPPVLLVIDEMADVVEIPELDDLARKCRGAGIYIIAATQYPTKKLLGSQIATNLVVRVCLEVESETESQTVMHTTGAEKLRYKGQFIAKRIIAGERKIIHGRAPYISDDELNRIIALNSDTTRNKIIRRDEDYVPEVIEWYRTNGNDRRLITSNKIRKRYNIGAEPAGRIRDLALQELGLLS